MYVKLIEGKIEAAPVNKDGICNYNLDIERMIKDGYKLFIAATPPSETEIRMFHYEYKDNADNIEELVIYDETQEEATNREFSKLKKSKHCENNQKAEIARENQIFSLTVQNENCTFQTTRKTQQDLTTAKDFIMATGQPYQWFSDNNKEVYLTTDDVVNISTVFMQKANVYPRWSEYETLIEEALTIEELNNIVIDYDEVQV